MDGARIGSTALSFKPGPAKGGDYHFQHRYGRQHDACLADRAPAAAAGRRAERALTLEGGTHNPHAPPFDFLAKGLPAAGLPHGPTVTATLERSGFLPRRRRTVRRRHQPRVEIERRRIAGARANRKDTAPARSSPISHAMSPSANCASYKSRLNWGEDVLAVEEMHAAPGPGNLLMLEVEHAHVTEVFTGFGEVGRSAEAVASDAVDQCGDTSKARLRRANT